MDDYLPVRISTLRGDEPLPFPIYIFVGERGILYVRQGELLEKMRMKRLLDKNYQKFYIRLEHENLYREYVKANLAIAADPEAPPNLRASIVAGNNASIVENLLEFYKTRNVYDESKLAAKVFFDFLAQEPMVSLEILKIENLREDVAHHSVVVAVLASMLARKLGATGVENLIVGAFMHDIEHFYTGIELGRPTETMNAADQALHIEHAAAGYQRIAQIEHVDPEVLEIVRQHERNVTEILDPLSAMIASANQLDRLISFEKVDKKIAVKTLMDRSPGTYRNDHLQVFAEIFDSNF